MPRKKQIDEKALIKMIKDEVPQPEIMEAFGFKTSGQLKVAYLNALAKEGLVVGLTSSRGSKAAKPDSRIKVNKRGSLVIPKQLAERFELKIGDEFDVSRSAKGLSLKAVEDE